MYQGETECWCELLLRLLLLQAAGKVVGGFECEVSMEPEQSHLDWGMWFGNAPPYTLTDQKRGGPDKRVCVCVCVLVFWLFLEPHSFPGIDGLKHFTFLHLFIWPVWEWDFGEGLKF